MSNNTSKTGMKLRRILYRLSKYAMFIFSVITCYNLTAHILELRAERIKKEKNKRTVIVILSIVAWCASIAIGFALLLKYIKHLKKGYLLDFFDTEAYDVIEPDEEAPAESMIRSELCRSDDSADHEKLNTSHIPLDDEASEETL